MIEPRSLQPRPTGRPYVGASYSIKFRQEEEDMIAEFKQAQKQSFSESVRLLLQRGYTDWRNERDAWEKWKAVEAEKGA